MPDSPSAPGLDLASLSSSYRTGGLTPVGLVERLREAIDRCPDPAIWICRLPEKEVLAQAKAVEKRRATGENLPLYGVPFAIKDNIDFADYPTTAGCPGFAYVPRSDAGVVRRLLGAGAILVGKTNLDQFATGLAGDRTPYGTCCNPFHADYIAGGSSSGSAAAVSRGLVSFALGTDTAGSGRVPAGCTSVVGLKPTHSRLPKDGVVPACQSLDCVSIFALTAADARQVLKVAEARPMKAEATPARDGGGFSFAVPAERDLEFFGDDGQATLFRDSILGLERLGGRPVTVDFAPFRAVAGLLYEGPFVAERLAALGSFLQEHPEALHPVTRGILEGGSKYTAVDVFRAYHKLEQLRPVCLDFFRHAEVLVVPTMPTVPKTADVHADSLGWSRRLGHYTNFVNLLGLAAIAVPAGFTPAGLPGGITLIGPAGSDDRLCELGIAWQRHLDIPFGAIGWRLAAAPVHTAPSEGWVRVAVAGAHLKGQPLHAALLQTGARFVRTCRTASRYRFVALLDLDPPRPGLLRDDHRAGSTEVEIYDLPLAGFGVLVASVAPPLAIGTVELADGEAVKGFLCESHAAARARDITEFGGWVAFRKSLHSAGTVS